MSEEYYRIVSDGIFNVSRDLAERGMVNRAMKYLDDCRARLVLSGEDHVAFKEQISILSQTHRTGDRDLYRNLPLKERLRLAGLSPKEQIAFMTIEDVR